MLPPSVCARASATGDALSQLRECYHFPSVACSPPRPHTDECRRLAATLERTGFGTGIQYNDLSLQAAFFTCSDWHDIVVLGWRGCLERLRFGMDPSVETFYFAGL